MRHVILQLCLSFVTGMASPVSADPLDVWQWRNPLPQGRGLFQVVYAQGRYVAVGSEGVVLISTNAIDWSVRKLELPVVGALLSIAYGNGMFVAVGAGTWTSSDATNWVQQNPMYWNKIIFTNSMFLAVGNAGAIATSTSGSNWVFKSSGTTVPLNDITWANGLYVVAGGYYTNSALLTSSDATTWSNRTFTSDELYGVAYGSGRFVAIGDDFYPSSFVSLTSVDGVNWMRSASNTPAYSYGIAFRNGTFVLAGDGLWSSPDGVVWTNRYAEFPNSFYSVTACPDLFVALGNAGSIVTSVDGTNWIRRSSGTWLSLYALAASSNTVLAVGGRGATLLCSNNATWTYRNVGASTSMTSVVYAEGRFVATGNIGAAPAIFQSSDGVEWTSQTQPGSYLGAIAFAEGQFVVVGGDGYGNSGFIRTSSNAVDWIGRSVPTTDSLGRICHGNGLFVAAGGRGVILTSADRGATWMQRISGISNGIYGLSWAGGLFVAADTYGTILTSSNGIAWTARQINGFSTIYDVAFGNGVFVGVGGEGILTSSNAIDWIYRPRVFAWDRLNAVLWVNDSFLIAGEWGILLQSAPLTAPRFMASRQNGGSLEFSVAYTQGQPYRVQTATNLNGLWVDWRRITDSTSPTRIIETNLVSPRQFYRVVAP
jgi:hypothetical protein